MKPSDYLASRFMQSQIANHTTRTPKTLAENQALQFLMWAGITLQTALQVFLIVAHYFGVLVKLRRAPRSAADIYADAKIREGNAQAARAKIAAEITDNLKKESFPPKPLEPGMH